MASGHGVPKPDTATHPGRQVGKGRWTPNYDYNPQAEEDEEIARSEPDYEDIVRRRQEARRPDWA